MKLRIEHSTRFEYDAPISEGYAELRLRPLDGGSQRCLAFALTTDPPVRVRQYADWLGNDVHHFDVLAPHERLLVRARSEVLTSDSAPRTAAALSPLERFDYAQPSARVPFSAELRELAAPCHVAGDALATLARVTAAVRARLRYESGATDVLTDAAQALARGAGVCQDFAHLALGACRLNGLPARYVSGYVAARDPRSAAASHAWIDVFVEGQGWVSLDPTHDTPQTPRHVRVAVGRDYSDVPPTRGVFKGRASETLAVTVAVELLE